MARVYLAILSCSLLLLFCEQPQATFVEQVIDANGPNHLWTKTIGDLNGDGQVDLIAGGHESGGLVWYTCPDFKKQVITDLPGCKTDAEVIDLDQDGDSDLVHLFNTALVWIENPGWIIHLIDSIALHDIEIADFDGDGLTDIVGRDQAEFGSRGDSLFFYKQLNPSSWVKTVLPCINGEGLLVADLNRDQRPDILLNTVWLENTGQIEQWHPHILTTTWTWRNTFIATGDINQDGRVDVVYSPAELAGQRYRLAWFEAPENPTDEWTEHIIEPEVEAVLHFVGTADFNLDGRLDIMTAEMQQGADPDQVLVYYQTENIQWQKEIISTEGSHSIRLVDIDGDGDVDAFGGNWQENIVKVWINNVEGEPQK